MKGLFEPNYTGFYVSHSLLLILFGMAPIICDGVEPPTSITAGCRRVHGSGNYQLGQECRLSRMQRWKAQCPGKGLGQQNGIFCVSSWHGKAFIELTL